ncbi:MAG: Uma2 family endonuclease [Deltaproteobacteria bacterium]|nr:Uma2 family endonuclease [Deltaproteobacteria bacterium]
MPQPTLVSPMTAAEYLEWEKQSAVKHEYVAGEVFAMSGASDAHVTLSLKLASMLLGHLAGGPCRTYMADMKVKLSPIQAFYYPDVFVTCDERDLSNDYFKEFPRLIVEVLSPSTAAFDRGLKFEHYASLPDLQEYVLMDSERRTIDCFRRKDGGEWVLHRYRPGEEARFESLGFAFSIDSLYENVRLPSASPVL